mmetsp:Transcript_23197/g.40848  ORF Transcript_23197/g.40848 Transcript_23197/m.40848 type:complete len:95 (-) Transcript_23197:118-402(-)
MGFLKDLEYHVASNITLYGSLAFIVLPTLGIGFYSGIFTGQASRDTTIIMCFVAFLFFAIGGYMYYVNSLLDSEPNKKKKKTGKKSKTYWSIGD